MHTTPHLLLNKKLKKFKLIVSTLVFFPPIMLYLRHFLAEKHFCCRRVIYCLRLRLQWRAVSLILFSSTSSLKSCKHKWSKFALTFKTCEVLFILIWFSLQWDSSSLTHYILYNTAVSLFTHYWNRYPESKVVRSVIFVLYFQFIHKQSSKRPSNKHWFQLSLVHTDSKYILAFLFGV